ncbi:MAG: cytochrome c oxidase subunit II [Bdellovibrionales bacterium]
MNRLFGLFLTALSFLTLPAAAQTAASEFEPVDKGLNLIPAASPMKHMIHDFHNELLIIIFAISIFVLALLIYTIVRYHHRVNKTPSTTTHNTLLEVIWTAIPVIILIIIIIPSFKVLYYQERIPEDAMIIKAEGRQWYWTYEYPDAGIKFDARGLWDTAQTTDEDALKLAAESRANWLINNGDPRRLLETDNRVVLPVDTNIRVQITGADVIHAWAVPAFGVKRDAQPGRLNETWFRAEKEGVFYGQCSEICGTGHGFMPIAIEIVSKERYAQWLEEAKQKFAMDPQPTTTPQQN